VHMRRHFYELATPGPAPIASEALKHIAEFFAIEKDIRGRSAVSFENREPGRSPMHSRSGYAQSLV
jgi:hypothetical protein